VSTQTSSEGETGDGDALDVFDQQELRLYEVETSDEDWAWLQANAGMESYVSANLTVDGVHHGEVGLRYKGSATLDACLDDSGAMICDKASMKLKFNEYDPEAKFHELKRLNFHVMSQDPSFLRERITYKLFQDFGVPTSRSVHAQLSINGGEPMLFALVEQIDGRFTRDRFPSDGEGNLYKEVWPQWLLQDPYLAALKTNEDENPSAEKMVAFATALSEAGDAGFPDVIDSWMGRQELAHFLAVDRATDNWDGVMGWWCYMGNCGNHNFLWYEETLADRVHLIPWDHDHTLAYPNFFQEDFGLPAWNDDPGDCEPIVVWLEFARRGARCDSIVDRMVRLLWDDYAAASEELLSTLFTEEAINADIDQWSAQIAEAVAADPFGPTSAQWEADLAYLRSVIVPMRDAILADI
jgi:spore coat protein CotH